MQNLPLEIVNNILIIQYEEQMKQLKEQLKIKEVALARQEHNCTTMKFYMDTHSVTCCDDCHIYGDDDEIMCYEEYDREFLCEGCAEFRENEVENNNVV
tara:strand:- start:68 stop:364 length:297 start_codon:yes stop_codon:yes gene_type:complete